MQYPATQLYILIFFLFPAIGICQLPDSLIQKVRNSTDEYTIQYDSIPIAGSKTLPCLTVKVNGIGGFKFLIDLGSNVVLFKQSVVEEANMDVLIDRARGDIVKANKLEIGNTVFSNVYGAGYDNLDVDGVIGFNLLKNSNFFIDYPNMMFGFLNQEPVQKDSTYTAYEIIDRMPYLKSKIGSRNSYINFDTGAGLWLYFPLNLKDSFQLHSPVKEFKTMGNNQTGETKTYIGQIKDSIFFGNYLIASPYVVFDPNIEDVYVGSSLLKEFKLSFYINQQLVKMERAKKGNLILVPKNQDNSF